MIKLPLIGFNLVLLICLSIFTPVTDVNDDWEMVKETDYWTVYTRIGSSSSVKEVKVEGIMHAGYESVKLAMSDINSYPEWVYSCLESYKFDAINENKYYSYTLTDLPFPLKNRDLIVYTEQSTSNTGEWYSVSKSVPSQLPESKGAVRIKKYNAWWKMRQGSNNTVEFVYQLKMEPGGILPAWVVNLAIAKVPLKTLTALEERSKVIMKK